MLPSGPGLLSALVGEPGTGRRTFSAAVGPHSTRKPLHSHQQMSQRPARARFVSSQLDGEAIRRHDASHSKGMVDPHRRLDIRW